MRCGQRGCSCTTCEDCSRLHENCICELRQDTERLLNKNDYTYEDFAHSARYLLQRWLDGE